MSESRVIDGTEERASLQERLCACLPLVFLIGAPGILITRYICLAAYPSVFVNDSPTISETASHAPASLFFEYTMTLVTLCIIVSWSLNILRNQRRLTELSGQGVAVLGPTIGNYLASVVGMAAGFSLLLIAVYNLHDGHDVHMYGSWVFYIAQAMSITFDILFVLWMRRIAGAPPAGDGLGARIAVAVTIFLGSWFFLYMYENKGHAASEYKYLVQQVYVGSEYFVAMFFLAYPMTAYSEARRHFREFAIADRRG